jgi:hypothetical protein
MSATDSRQDTDGGEVVLFAEDFRALSPGAISAFRSAFGEYHTHPTPPGGGAWGDAVLCTGQKGLTWRVVGDGEDLVFEACQQMVRRPAILVLDDYPSLAEYTFSADVRPLSSRRSCGLVFGYHTNRTFFAVLWEGGGYLALVRNEHDGRQCLARVSLPVDVDGYRRIIVAVADGQATVFVDDEQVMGGVLVPFETGVLDGERREGKVGLIAYSPARFRVPRVTATPQAAAVRSKRLSDAQRELERLREQNPAPEPMAECSLGDFGAGRNLRVADLDGDGELEFLLAQPSVRGDGNYCQIACLTAFRRTGEVLWQIGRPVKPTALTDAPTYDLPFQVADVDGDGRPELVMCRDWQLQVRDARTGELRAAVPTPRSTPGLNVIGWLQEDYYDRICGDSIHLCDLGGRGRPGELLIKDRYSNLWAYETSTLEPLWHAVLNTGHYPLAFDVNGDGRDEVFCGYSLLDAEGRLLWQHGFDDHVDGIGVGRFDPDSDEFRVALVAGDAGFFLLSAVDGRVVARHDTGHLQKMSIGNLLPDRTGVEIATITYWASQGVFSVFDGRGVKLHESEPWHAASPLVPVGWRGDGQDFLLLSTHPQYGGLLDGLGRRVVMFPEGHPHLACDAVDLDGDGREEVLAWDFERLVIFKAAGQPMGRIPTRYTGPLHNRSNYKANVAGPPALLAPPTAVARG